MEDAIYKAWSEYSNSNVYADMYIDMTAEKKALMEVIERSILDAWKQHQATSD